MSSRGSVSGIAPSRIAVARKLAQANSSSRIRERAAWRACSSRSELLGLDSRPCSATSTRLRRTSCSERSKQLAITASNARTGSRSSATMATNRLRKSSMASSMISYRQCCLDSK